MLSSGRPTVVADALDELPRRRRPRLFGCAETRASRRPSAIDAAQNPDLARALCDREYQPIRSDVDLHPVDSVGGDDSTSTGKRRDADRFARRLPGQRLEGPGPDIQKGAAGRQVV